MCYVQFFLTCGYDPELFVESLFPTLFSRLANFMFSFSCDKMRYTEKEIGNRSLGTRAYWEQCFGQSAMWSLLQKAAEVFVVETQDNMVMP